jgi:hypothetical protein
MKCPARSHDPLANRALERDGNGNPLCPVCDNRIRPDDSSGSVDGKVAHLACWLKRRQEPDARAGQTRPVTWAKQRLGRADHRSTDRID